MQLLLNIEAAQGRKRDIEAVGGPRNLDLDLLLYGQQQLTSALLVLPHPRLHQRAFVLYPLSEINPELNIPGKAGVSALLARLADDRTQRVERMTGSIC